MEKLNDNAENRVLDDDSDSDDDLFMGSLRPGGGSATLLSRPAEKPKASPKPSAAGAGGKANPSKIYTEAFMKQFKSHNDCPPKLKQLYLEIPDLEPRTTVNKVSQGGFSGDGQYQRNDRRGNRQHQQQQGGFQNNQGYNNRRQGAGNNNNNQNKMSPQQNNKPAELSRRAADPWQNPLFVSDKEKMLRTVKGTLNKLTPDTLARLCLKLCELFSQIKEDDVYSEAVALVYDKAVTEPNFSTMYTELCGRLNETNEAKFRRVLLSKCEKEFQKIKQQTIEIPSNLDAEDVALLKDKYRRRQLGNVKFIGELFKYRLLSEVIMHDCVKLLFETILAAKKKKEVEIATMEGSAELLCKLLTTSGKRLDTPQAKSYMDAYFKYVSQFVNEEMFSKRLSFMFQDLLELRENNWVPRREDNTPKTISQIHADAMMKEIQDQYMLADMSTDNVIPQQTIPPTTPPVKSPDSAPSSTGKKNKKKNKSPSPAPPPQTSTPQSAALILSASEQNAINKLLTGYLNAGPSEAEHVCRAIANMQQPAIIPAATVELALSLAFEKRDQDRQFIAALLTEMAKTDLLNQNIFAQGLQPIVSMIDDLQIDIPFVRKYLLFFVESVYKEKIVSRGWVETLSNKIPELKKIQF